MKRTKAMQTVLNGTATRRTTESHELYLCMRNESRLSGLINGIRENLGKKYAKGAYDADRAIDAFYPLADATSRLYNRDFGYTFTPLDRFRACVEMVEGFDPEEWI